MKVGEVYALLGMDFSQFNKDERTARQRTQTLGSSLSGIIKNAFSFTLGMGFFEAVKQGFRSTVGTMFSFNAQMEQAQIGFSTMLGSAQRAKRFLDDVAAFAAKTPFEFPDLLDASKRMLAYGFAAEDVLPTMEAVGNATASVGLGAQGIDRIILALGQMRAKGKVSGEEMRQLTETGIPAWEFLAEAMGKSTAEVMKLSERGLIPADQAIKMLVEGMNKRFPSMMSQMENTWDGVTSTIRDVWQMTIGAMTKGLFRGVVSWLQRVRDVATGFYDAFRAGGLQYAIEQTFGAGVAASVSTLTSALKGLWGIVVGVGRTIVRYWSTIGPLTAWVVKGFLAFKTAGFVVRMAAAAVKTFTAASLAMRGSLVATSPSFLKLISDIVLYYKCLIPATVGTFGFSTALTYLKAALMAVQTALGAVIWPILIIGALLMGGTALWSKYTQAVQSAAQKAQMDKMAQQQKEYMDAVNAAAQGTGAQADALEELGKASQKNLQSFDEVHTLMEETAAADLGIGTTLDSGLTPPVLPEMELQDFTFDMDAAIAEAKAEMGGFWGWLWDDIKNGAVNAWNGITGLLSNLWQGAVNLARPIWEPLAPFFSWLWEGIKTMITAVWDAIGPYLMSLWSGIVTIAQTVWGVLGSFFIGLWSGIKTAVEVAWGLIQYFLATYWLGIIELAKAVWSFLGPFFEKLWEGVKKVAVSVWSFLSTVLPPIWNAIVAMAKTIWSAIGPFFELLWAGVKWAFENIWRPLAAWLEGVWNGIKTVAETVWNVIQKVIVDPFNAARQTVESIANAVKDVVQKAWDFIAGSIKAVKDVIYDYIVEPFLKAKNFIEGIIAKAREWGRNLVAAFTGGVKSGTPAAINAAAEMAGGIQANIGFESPTKEGPGRYADRWAPNLMRMYAKGILDNVSMVQSAAGAVARSLMPMTAVPSPVFAGMGDVGRSGASRGGGLADELAAAIRGVGGGTNRPIEITVNIDSRRMARALIPAIQSEQDRIEADTIVRAK